jgi:uncharacterized protein (DUF1778 family)
MATVTAQAERLEARITAEQKDLLREAATLRGVTLTDFVVASAYEAAVRTIRERQVIELGREDQSVFVSALLNPDEPNEKLRAAARRHRFGHASAR